MISHKEKVKELIFIMQGKCNLYGYCPSFKNPEEILKLLVVRLPAKSWYGDAQILLNLVSSFQLEAGEINRKPNDKQGNVESYIHCYKLNGRTLTNICKEYPVFERFLIVRATQRRTYFFKIFDELRQINEL